MGKIFRFLSSRTSYALRVTSPLTTEQCVDVLCALAATGRVRSADVVELNLEACETDEERAASAANAAALLNALLSVA